MSNFTKRAYGFVVVKSVNANYNADFTGQPRTLPSGKVYATDKALKFTVRHYIKNNFPNERVFLYKRLNKEMKPLSLDHAFNYMFPEHKDLDAKKDDTKSIYIKDLLSCIDIRLFGSTFAKKAKNGNIAISIHGPVQVTHGINIWHKSDIYTEQIISPFNSNEDSSNEQSTIGRQSKLEEGHYVHHFSINPKNLEDIVKLGAEGTPALSENDIEILKEALCKGATYYDSASKAGVQNEMLFYVELKEGSKVILPNFTELLNIKEDGDSSKRKFDFSKIKEELDKYSDEIEEVEIYYDQNIVSVENLPRDTKEKDLV